MKNNKYKVSIIIPAYNAGEYIDENVKSLDALLKQSGNYYEIIVVIDGYPEKSIQQNDAYRKLKKLKPYNTNLKVEYYKDNGGKGYAVRRGMQKARGEVIGFVDAGYDLDYKYLINMITTLLEKNADIVIGSKLHPDSKVDYTAKRQIISIVYKTLVKILFRKNYTDTQVGMKVFKKEVIKSILPRLVVNGFAFDVEILVTADFLGYKNVIEAPVKVTSLNEKSPSTVFQLGLIKTSLVMIWDTIEVFYRLNYKRGKA